MLRNCIRFDELPIRIQNPNANCDSARTGRLGALCVYETRTRRPERLPARLCARKNRLRLARAWAVSALVIWRLFPTLVTSLGTDLYAGNEIMSTIQI